MTLPPIDFSPLEPSGGDAHWEQLARRIEAAAVPELARRAVRAVSWRDLLMERTRPLLAAAAVIVAMAGATIALARRPVADPTATALAALVGISYDAAVAITDDRAPGLDRFLLFQGED